MIINFQCDKCGGIFDCDVGTVTVPENSHRPHFEKEIICPQCGQRSMDEVLLTELGQSQLTEATLDFEFDDIVDSEDDDFNGFGFYEAECQGCDTFTRVDDLGLCEECTGKLERDFIRQRDWDYSATAFGVPASKREELRRQVIAKYGEELELIVPSKGTQKKKSRKRKAKQKRRGRSERGA